MVIPCFYSKVFLVHKHGGAVIELTDHRPMDGTIGNAKMEVEKDGQCLEERREELEEVVVNNDCTD